MAHELKKPSAVTLDMIRALLVSREQDPKTASAAEWLYAIQALEDLEAGNGSWPEALLTDDTFAALWVVFKGGQAAQEAVSKFDTEHPEAVAEEVKEEKEELELEARTKAEDEAAIEWKAESDKRFEENAKLEAEAKEKADLEALETAKREEEAKVKLEEEEKAKLEAEKDNG